MRTDSQPRRRRGLGVLFAVSTVLLLGSWLVLDSSAKPCNTDDFTGCSALGEVSVIAFLILVPVTIGLGLILALTWIADQLRRR